MKYDGNEDPSTWTTVLDVLEEAYREIGQKFNFFPSRPIIVVLHTKISSPVLRVAPVGQTDCSTLSSDAFKSPLKELQRIERG